MDGTGVERVKVVIPVFYILAFLFALQYRYFQGEKSIIFARLALCFYTICLFVSNLKSLEVVCRGSDTQLQVDKNLNVIMKRFIR